MNLSERPVLFAVAAAAVVSVGTLVTTFIPLFMPATQPTSPYVRPYDPIEIEGRDIYIREGCNNCHTQTVRPLRTEVARYGEYSKPEESAYDRPFLWGSRRTGPDLARIGGRYPDSWHYRHMADPRSMFAVSNMPAYAWLAARPLDTSLTARKVRVLGYGYDDRNVADRIDAFRREVAAAGAPFAEARSYVTPEALRGEITELDALVAYLQKVGRDLRELSERKAVRTPSPPAFASNPFAGNREALEEGEAIFRTACAVCHGEKGRGGIGPSLTGAKTYGGTDADLFASVSDGRAAGMPPFANILGEEKIWKVITYVRSLETA
jgi:cytochrome c oxidase cbb3-type subunit II